MGHHAKVVAQLAWKLLADYTQVRLQEAFFGWEKHFGWAAGPGRQLQALWWARTPQHQERGGGTPQGVP
jgi:hypothetical protein